MIRYCLLFVLLISAVFANAQVRLRLNYDKNWELTTKDSAVYIRVCVYDTLSSYFTGPVHDLYLSGKPQMIGFYKERKKEGDFTFYYENGQIESQGKFQNNMQVGTWKYFFENGNLRQEIEFLYTDIERVTKVNFLSDSSGTAMIKDGTGHLKTTIDQISVTGQYKNGLKDGTWKWEQTSRDYFIENFDNGVFVSGTKYEAMNKRLIKNTPIHIPHDFFIMAPLKLAITEALALAPGLAPNTYPILTWFTINGSLRFPVPEDALLDEEVYEANDLDSKPEVIGGQSAVLKFIRENLKYPAEARRRNNQGSVYIEFIVAKDGGLSNVKILKGVGGGCDEEALRIVKKLGEEVGWVPGRKNGKPVNVRFVFPLKFQLG